MFASLLAASTSNRYFLLEQTGQVSFPLGEKNSLESKNSVCVWHTWLDKESKLSRNCQKKAILPKTELSSACSNAFAALSIDFFPSFFFFFSSFPSSCCVSQRRSFHISHATRPAVRSKRLSTTLKAHRGGVGRGGVNIRAVSSPMFLFRRSEELFDETMRSKRK